MTGQAAQADLSCSGLAAEDPSSHRACTQMQKPNVGNTEVDAAIAALEATVKACRARVPPVPAASNPEMESTCSSTSALQGASSPSHSTNGLSTSSMTAQMINVGTLPGVSAPLATVAGWMASPGDLPQPAMIEERVAYHAEGNQLRAELQEANVELQSAQSELAATTAAARGSCDRHVQWVRTSEAAAERLRADNERLKRSLQQAGLEEKRMAELIRTQPLRADERLRGWRANCKRLVEDNHRIEMEITQEQAELSIIRDGVARHTRRPAHNLEVSPQSAGSSGIRSASATLYTRGMLH